MKKEERDFLYFLEDIALAMQRIQQYTDGLPYAEFLHDYKTVDAVIRNFEIIGEAAKNLPAIIKNKHTHLPWEEMYRLRNKISHEYFGIDYEILWDIVTNQLPANLKNIEEIIKKEKKNADT